MDLRDGVPLWDPDPRIDRLLFVFWFTRPALRPSIGAALWRIPWLI
jgi:hypothetical protein